VTGWQKLRISVIGGAKPSPVLQIIWSCVGCHTEVLEVLRVGFEQSFRWTRNSRPLIAAGASRYSRVVCFYWCEWLLRNFVLKQKDQKFKTKKTFRPLGKLPARFFVGRLRSILKYARHCEERSNLYIGRAILLVSLYSIEIASFLAMTCFEVRVRE